MIILDIKSLILLSVVVYIVSKNTWLTILIILFWVHFMNSPDMSMSESEIDPNLFYSPCSGYIQSIKRDENNVNISLFLNVFDNHTQYIPIQSKLLDIKRYSGLFVPAYKEHSVNNSRVENLLYSTKHKFNYTITQITGILTRRIISFKNTSPQLLTPGERLGFIVLGSRVDIKIPTKNIKSILVKQNTHVNPMEPMISLV